MRLLTKTTLINAAVTAVLLALGSQVLVALVQREIREDIDEQLRYVARHARGGLGSVLPNEQVTVRRVDPSVKGSDEYKDTVMFDPLEKERKPYRQLRMWRTVDDSTCVVVVRRGLFESEDLMEVIGVAVGWIGGALVLCLLAGNVLVSRLLWRPFYATLRQIAGFDLKASDPIFADRPATREFRDLNTFLDLLAHRVRGDYLRVKEFTENASHEIQSPAAVVLARLESALADENLTQDRRAEIHDAYRAAKRISRLNRSLLQLTRIQSGQYLDETDVSVPEVVDEQVREHAELARLRDIDMMASGLEPLRVRMNRALADTLVSVLIRNAIMHNSQGGSIQVTVAGSVLTVVNTGDAPDVEPGKVFERFMKSSRSSGSLGLGLAIAGAICERYGYQIAYAYEDGHHRLDVRFEPAEIIQNRKVV